MKCELFDNLSFIIWGRPHPRCWRLTQETVLRGLCIIRVWSQGFCKQSMFPSSEPSLQPFRIFSVIKMIMAIRNKSPCPALPFLSFLAGWFFLSNWSFRPFFESLPLFSFIWWRWPKNVFWLPRKLVVKTTPVPQTQGSLDATEPVRQGSLCCHLCTSGLKKRKSGNLPYFSNENISSQATLLEDKMAILCAKGLCKGNKRWWKEDIRLFCTCFSLSSLSNNPVSGAEAIVHSG